MKIYRQVVLKMNNNPNNGNNAYKLYGVKSKVGKYV